MVLPPWHLVFVVHEEAGANQQSCDVKEGSNSALVRYVLLRRKVVKLRANRYFSEVMN